MQRLQNNVFSVLAVALFIGAVGCSDDGVAGSFDADLGPQTLAEELAAAGLPPGNYRVNAGGVAVCIRIYTYPGGGQVSEALDLSGYSNFELLVADDEITIRGTYDDLSARWTDAQCVEYDAGQDELTNLEPCGGDEDEACTPFSLVRLCAADDGPTFFAAAPDCGHNTFPATPQ